LKDSYLTAGIRLGPLIRMIRRNPVSLRPKYLCRMLFLAQSAFWSSLFSRLEALRYGRILAGQPVPGDPIFIIGHWRTGSTFLHQLMSQDPSMTSPTLFQVAEPDSFLTAFHYYKPIFKSFVSRHRPMDMVRLGMNEPQEDEYAIYRMTRYSPLEKLVFPERKGYFLTGVNAFLPEGNDLTDWEEKVSWFFRKVHFQTGKRIVSKNPFNSLRIPTLLKLFPGAQFIHIVRNPLDSVPSTINMWTIVQKQNCLNRNIHKPEVSEVCDVMNYMMRHISEQSGNVPEGRFCELRYEDLESDPAGMLKTLYNKLDIPFTKEFEENIRKFLIEVSGYKKNTFTLTDNEKETIRDKMKEFMARYCYFQ
jgi:omega-hydroxy-beta-dihydromenaquinone-9 sulfotransferase